MSEYFDRAGQPMDYRDWAERFGDPDYKMVDKDNVGDYTVSTVWLGLDHSFGGERQIFETVIFGDRLLDWETTRYATEDEARAGHAAAVKRVIVVTEAFGALVEQTDEAVRSVAEAVSSFGKDNGLDYDESIVRALFEVSR